MYKSLIARLTVTSLRLLLSSNRSTGHQLHLAKRQPQNSHYPELLWHDRPHTILSISFHHLHMPFVYKQLNPYMNTDSDSISIAPKIYVILALFLLFVNKDSKPILHADFAKI